MNNPYSSNIGCKTWNEDKQNITKHTTKKTKEMRKMDPTGDEPRCSKRASSSCYSYDQDILVLKQVSFDEMMAISTSYQTNRLIWIFPVLPH
jgi:hypothetical protein